MRVTRRRLLVIAAAGAALALALSLALLRPSDEAPQVSAAKTSALIAPAKRRPLADVRGRTLIPPPERIALRETGGKPALVNVWASWCIPCRQEAPVLARLAGRHSGTIAFRGVDIPDERGAARAFVRRYGLTFPHLFDPKGSAASRLGAYGIPTTFLVDRRGRIAAVRPGRQEEPELSSALAGLAAETP